MYVYIRSCLGRLAFISLSLERYRCLTCLSAAVSLKYIFNLFQMLLLT